MTLPGKGLLAFAAAATLAATLIINVGAESSAAGEATITVDTGSDEGRVPAAFLGANHRYTFDGYGTWDSTADAPEPDAVAKARKMGLKLLRWPGGTVANTTLWKGTIGQNRICQRDGRIELGAAADPADDVLAARNPSYGLVEHLRFAAAVSAQTQVMVPMAIGTATDAADLVEFLNTPAGDGVNPNGGVDWAELRPGDHRQPYDIARWEVGNENYHTNQRYWMSQNEDDALEQYITGGSRRILSQRLGKLSVPDPQGKPCGGSTAPVPSDGTKNQTFDVNYPTVRVDDFELRVDGELWRRVDDLAGAGPAAKQYVLNQFRGTVAFGDGTNGTIPPRGVHVVASYTSVHKGYVEFRAAMRQVDPNIEVCAAWGRAAFATKFEALKTARIPESSRYDCLTTHPYTHFTGGGMADWDSRVEAHDWHMLGARDARQKFVDIRSAVGRNAQNTPYVAISESGALWGPEGGGAYPEYTYAMTHALYMATQWADWLELGVPWVLANDLSSGGMYTLLGGRGGGDSDFMYSAEAASREAIRPMLDAGGLLLRNTITGNPQRIPNRTEMCDGAGTPQSLCTASYDTLRATATRGPDGTVHLLVVNRSPVAGDTVDARIVLRDFASNGRASVRTIAPHSFSSANTKSDPLSVTMTTSCRSVDAGKLTAAVSAHSVTLFSLPPAGGKAC